MKPLVRILTALLLTALEPAFAVEPDEVLDDPALEARARALSRELRCITCQSQSIDDSDAPLAKDLRVIVRERLAAGDSDTEVVAYLTDRYGDYVRLKPAMRGDTAILWLTPFLALILAGGVALFYFRKLNPADAIGGGGLIGDGDEDDMDEETDGV